MTTDGIIHTADGRTARHSSATNEHMTPPAIVDAARRVLGGIDLDPASCDAANVIVRAGRYFTIGDDGYTQPWAGRVFLNPPGGRVAADSSAKVAAGGASSAKRWWFKLARSWVSGDVTAAVFLAFNLELLQTTQVRPELDADGDALPIPLDFPLCIPKRRITFFVPGADGAFEIGGQPTHANAIVFLPPSLGRAEAVDRFVSAFSSVGRVRL